MNTPNAGPIPASLAKLQRLAQLQNKLQRLDRLVNARKLDELHRRAELLALAGDPDAIEELDRIAQLRARTEMAR